MDEESRSEEATAKSDGSSPALQIFQVNAWYHLIDIARVRPLAEEVLRDSGFEFGALPDQLGSWDLVRVGGRPAWCSVTQASEDHTVFEIKAEIDAQRALSTTFLSAFTQLLAEPRLTPAECMLTAANEDVYPFFTHSFCRGSAPVTIVEVPEDVEDAAVHTPSDADYWDIAGRSLHFVASATVARTAAPAPEDWARKIRAKAIAVSRGVVFDCGWSGTWPLPVFSAGHARSE